MSEKPAVTSVSRPAESAHLLMLVAMMIFALNYIISRWAVGDTPPYIMGFVRWGGGALILMPFAWSHRSQQIDFLYVYDTCIHGDSGNSVARRIDRCLSYRRRSADRRRGDPGRPKSATRMILNVMVTA